MDVLIEMMDGRVREYALSTEALMKDPRVLAVEVELRADRVVPDGELRVDITTHQLAMEEGEEVREVAPGVVNAVGARSNVASVVLANTAELNDAMRVTMRSGEDRRVVFWREGTDMLPVIGQDVERERLRRYESPAQADADRFCLEAADYYLARDEVWSWPGFGDDDVEAARLQISERLGHPFDGLGALRGELARREEAGAGGTAPDGDPVPPGEGAPAGNEMAAFLDGVDEDGE